MNEVRWLIRMSHWARNPPPLRRVILVFAVIGLCLAIVGIEWLGYWPDWLTAERVRAPKF
jgi:hypothetical protein